MRHINTSHTSHARVNNSHLPAGTTQHFTKLVLPIALDTTGALDPWEYPDDKQILEMWNLIFGLKDDHPFTNNNMKSELLTTMKSLACFTSLGVIRQH